MYEITELINGDRGKNYPSKDKLHSSGIPFISAINLEHGTVVKDKLLYLSEEQYNLLGSGKLQKDDLIFCLRGSLGKNGIYPFENGAIASSLVILRLFSQKLLNLKYFNFYINSPLMNSEINKYNNGTAQPNLSAGNVEGFYFPLPPLNEQHRIVAKIEELSPFIEQYDQKEQQLTALNKNFPEQLKKSILQAAIQGKLTEQLITDEPVSELLKRIQAEKVRLILEKKLKKPKHSSEIIIRDNLAYEIKDGVERCIADEIPFEIPESWYWVRLGDISETNIGLTYSPSDVSKNGTIVLRSGNIQNGKLNIQNDIIRVNIDISENKKCYKNDLLICARNGSKSLVGKTAIIDKDGYSFGAFMAILRSPFYQYIYHFLSSPLFRNDFDGLGTTTINQITQNNLNNRLIPLPPIEEQKRIVEKVELLLSQINHL